MQQRQAAELEAKDRELAEKINWANLEHIKSKLSTDMEVLKHKFMPSKERDAREAALDMQYLQGRQQIFGLLSIILCYIIGFCGVLWQVVCL